MSFHDLADITRREMAPGCRARFVHGENMTLSYWDLEVEAEIPFHSHVHEQVTSVIEGKLRLTVGDETTLLTPGRTAVIPPNVEHSAKALTACYVIDAFAPVREDYK